MFKATRLNSDTGLRAAAIPAIIREPELAFDAQQWRDPKRYSMIPHTPVSPQLVSASAIIIFAQTRANERYGDVTPTGQSTGSNSGSGTARPAGVAYCVL